MVGFERWLRFELAGLVADPRLVHWCSVHFALAGFEIAGHFAASLVAGYYPAPYSAGFGLAGSAFVDLGLAGLVPGRSEIADLVLIELVAVGLGPVEPGLVDLGPVVLGPVVPEPVVPGSAELEAEPLASRELGPGLHLGLLLVRSAARRPELEPTERQRASLRQVARWELGGKRFAQRSLAPLLLGSHLHPLLAHSAARLPDFERSKWKRVPQRQA